MRCDDFIELFRKGEAVLSFHSDTGAFNKMLSKFRELNISFKASKNGAAASSIEIASNAQEIRAQDIDDNTIDEDTFMSLL